MDKYIKEPSFKTHLKMLIENALHEDNEDATSLSIFSPDDTGSARLLCKEDGVLACLEESLEVFRYLDNNIKIKTYFKDTDTMRKGEVLAEIQGKVLDILRGERICLNIIQRACGIASKTAELTYLIKGTRAKILDTRKTAPGLRFLDKYSVVCGGGMNHRYGLSDMIMIKDNHIDRAGSITAAVNRVRLSRFAELPKEVECRTLEDVKECLKLNIDRMMLDNMSIDKMQEAVLLVNGKIPLEASGGINEKTIRAVAETGVDFISVGSLTHSVKATDISLKINK